VIAMRRFSLKARKGALGYGLGAVVAIVVAAPLVAQQAPARPEWPQYRGSSRDGSAVTFTVPREWPEQLVKKWSVDVGTGYATPIVDGNRVYMFSRRGDDEVLAALDADNGRELWKVSYAAPFTMHSAARPHGQGPKSTPLLTDGTLVAIGMTGVVTAVEAATGKQLWQKPGTVPVPMYTSHAFSPTAARVGGRRVAIFHLGGQDEGALSAIDVQNGNVVWRWTGDGPGYGSPVIADLGGTTQVITITQKKVVGVDLATGTLLWERPYVNPSTANSNTPLVHGQNVIVSGNAGPTVAFTVAKNGAQWTTTNVWENPDSPLRNTNMVLAGDMLFGLSNRNMGQYFGVDVATGKTLWLSPGRQALNAAITRAGDTLMSLEDDGELVIVKKSPAAFEVVKKYKVAAEATWAEPSFAGNRIFIKDVSTLTLWTTA